MVKQVYIPQEYLRQPNLGVEQMNAGLKTAFRFHLQRVQAAGRGRVELGPNGPLSYTEQAMKAARDDLAKNASAKVISPSPARAGWINGQSTKPNKETRQCKT